MKKYISLCFTVLPIMICSMQKQYDYSVIIQNVLYHTQCYKELTQENLTPLLYCLSSPYEPYSFLFANANSINTPDMRGDTPIIAAAKHNNILAAIMLMQLGANPNFQNKIGKTALMFAASNGNRLLVEILLKHFDIKTLLLDNKNFTALDYALSQEHFDISTLIEDYLRTQFYKYTTEINTILRNSYAKRVIDSLGTQEIEKSKKRKKTKIMKKNQPSAKKQKTSCCLLS